ncbi:alpha/beta hydrolase [Propionibacteriaceae bacterium Y2011]
MERRRWVLWVVVAVCAAVMGYGVARVQLLVDTGPLVVGQDAISDTSSAQARVSVDDVGGSVINIRPASGDGDLLLVLYPGAPVRPQAYEWLGRALAAEGVQTVIPEMPLDLAVLDSGRAEELITAYAAGRPVVLAGHSLGGAMAAQWASVNSDALAGLVLMAAYPADNVTVAGVPALSIMAEHDEIATAADVRGGVERLPEGTELVVINGAAHSFFGRYGPQHGDGRPTVNRAAAEHQIVLTMIDFLTELR